MKTKTIILKLYNKLLKGDDAAARKLYAKITKKSLKGKKTQAVR